MRRLVVQTGEPVLREKCSEVKNFNPELFSLLDDMKETVRAEQGAGLAAPQIGVLKRIFVASFDGCKTFVEAINPVIVKAKGKHTEHEGCLFIPNVREAVERPRHVVVEAFDRYGNPITLKGDGFAAACFCHEIDHLDGILFIDRAVKK